MTWNWSPLKPLPVPPREVCNRPGCLKYADIRINPDLALCAGDARPWINRYVVKEA
jgi:hypothetical protein